MPFLQKNCLKCQCGREFEKTNLLLLKDIKGFEARKIYYKWCKSCDELVISLAEKDKATGKIYINENITGAAAKKILMREQKRIVESLPDLEYNSLYGWIYGHNVQIRNKKGKVVQIRQYASDFKGNKVLVKKIINSK